MLFKPQLNKFINSFSVSKVKRIQQTNNYQTRKLINKKKCQFYKSQNKSSIKVFIHLITTEIYT